MEQTKKFKASQFTKEKSYPFQNPEFYQYNRINPEKSASNPLRTTNHSKETIQLFRYFEKLIYHTNMTILFLFLNKCKKMIDEILTFLKSHFAFNKIKPHFKVKK